MKKILAVLLCLLCLVSSMAVSVSGAGMEDAFVYIGTMMGFEQDEPITYGILYDSNKLLSGISSVMYEPKGTVSIRNPGVYTVTDDFPLAVDYEFVCWEDKDTGIKYYPGDELYIDGKITLYAVWKEKDDNNIRPVRVFLTATQALKHLLKSLFGIFKVELVPDYDAIPATWFDVEFDFPEDEIGISRSYTIRVKTPEGVTYDSFSETCSIYFGGSIDDVRGEEYTYLKDDNGNYVTDSDGNRVIIDVKTVFKKQLVGATEYYAKYETNGEKDGDYQIIHVTLIDRVPETVTGSYVTFCLPRGILEYRDADNNRILSNTASVSVFTSRDT